MSSWCNWKNIHAVARENEFSLQNFNSDVIMTAAKLSMKDSKTRNHFNMVHKL